MLALVPCKGGGGGMLRRGGGGVPFAVEGKTALAGTLTSLPREIVVSGASH